MEDDFYATLKLRSGEEIFARVAASEEEDRTMLILHNPITVVEIKSKNGLVGYKVEPWLRTSRDDMFIVNLDNVITMSECQDMEMMVLGQAMVKLVEAVVLMLGVVQEMVVRDNLSLDLLDLY